MGAVVSLRRVRKLRAKGKADAQAAANRAAFGRTKAEKVADRTQQNRVERTLDGARLD